MLLVGSDGGLQALLTHPSSLVTKVYIARCRPPAETGQQPYYQDHNARLEAQRRKAEASCGSASAPPRAPLRPAQRERQR